MALPRNKQIQLLLLEKEKRLRIKKKTPAKRLQAPSIKELLSSTAKQTLQQSPLAVPAQIGSLPSGPRRAVLEGGGTALGAVAGPLGAGAGAAAGGTLADIADTTENPKVIEAVQAEFKKSGFSGKLAKNLAVQAAQSMSKDDIVSFFKKRGIEFGLGASLSGAAKGVTKSVIKSSRKSSAGAVKTGFADPKLATKVGQLKANRTLKNFKTPILRKEPIEKVQDLRKLIGSPKGQLELVLSLETKLAKGTRLSNAELLLGREASRKVMAKGGSNGELANNIFKKIATETEKRFPGASRKFKRVEKTIKAKQTEGKESTQSLISAVGSLKGKGLLKALIPSFGLKTGANLRNLLQATPGGGTAALAPIIKALLDKRKN